MLPTFIIAGAQKSGTTSLWYYLKAHPQVCMAAKKEPNFFNPAIGCGEHPDGRAPRYPGCYGKGLDWYQSQFPGCENARAVGEASTPYMSDDGAAELIHQHLPQVKLVFILRDPATRAFSNYWQEIKEGWKLPDFAEMAAQRHPALQRYLYVSAYHLHLKRYLGLFPQGQIGVFLYDDLEQEPEGLVRRLYRFIGVEETFVPPNLGQMYNQKSVIRYRKINQILAAMAYRWNFAFQQKPPGWMSKMALLMIKINSQPVARPKMPVEWRAAFIQELYPAIEFVEEYLGRRLPAWRTA